MFLILFLVNNLLSCPLVSYKTLEENCYKYKRDNIEVTASHCKGVENNSEVFVMLDTPNFKEVKNKEQITIQSGDKNNKCIALHYIDNVRVSDKMYNIKKSILAVCEDKMNRGQSGSPALNNDCDLVGIFYSTFKQDNIVLIGGY